jgi:transcriptional regulator with XRE-family HTH domain
MNVAPNLRRALKAKKLNQSQFAKLVGRPRSTISTWLKGGPGPRYEELPKIARELDTTVAELLGLAKP